MRYKILAMLLSTVLFAGCIGEVTHATENTYNAVETSVSVSDGDSVPAVSDGDGVKPMPTTTPAHAVNPIPTTSPNVSQEPVAVDISANTLQNGGFLQGIPAGDGAALAELTIPKYLSMGEDTYNKAENALLEAYDSFETSCDLSKYGIAVSEVDDFVSNVLNNNPRYFYVSSDITVYGEEGCATTVLIQYNSDEDDAEEMIDEYDAAIARFMKGVDKSWTDMEKALYINDYLARNCEYDLTYSKYSAYDALVDGTAVCQGYALACRALADEVDLECELVTSWSLNHAWNMVKVNGKCYHVDITWNDPVRDMMGRARHQFFLKSTKYFKSDDGEHLVKDDWVVDGGWKVSSASSTTYDDYFWNDVDSGFEYIDGAWYNFDGVDQIAKYTCNGKKFAKAGNLLQIDNYWYVPGGGGYYMNKFVGVSSYNGILYYSTDKVVYQYDFATGTSYPVFKLSEKQQKTYNIYNLFINAKGVMYCYLDGVLGTNEKIYKVMTIGKTATKYNIHFDGNGATSGTMKDMTNRKYATTYKLTANKFKRTGYVFTGWNTKADGTGKAYADKASVSKLTGINGGTVTLYAQWSEPYISDTKKTVYVGSSYTLKIHGSTIKSAVSSNPQIATVTAKGKVTAKKPGRTKVTLTDKNGKTYKCTVTVKKPYISSTKKTLSVGKSFTLKLTGTTIKSAKSSKTSIATVTSKGKVTAKKKGKVTITLKGKDGKNYKCVVTVK